MGPRHNKQIEKAITTLDKSDSVAISNEDRDAILPFKKTERIAAAIYILTDYLSDTEPLKRELRELGTILIKRIMSFRNSTTARRGVEEASKTIARMISLLNLAHIADILSSSHLLLLRQELHILSEMLDEIFRSNIQISGPGPIFEKSFFEPMNEQGSSKGQHLQHRNVRYERSRQDGRHPSPSRQGRRIVNGHFSSSMALQEGRRAKIIAVIREKGPLSIKDISVIFRDCGEKTLQRILARLVKENVLEKDGVKRWVRYAIKADDIS